MSIRRAAGLLLLRADGKFLLQHRDDHATRFPGYWGFFGGGLDENEDPETAMVRETKEELGIDVVNYHLVLHHHFSDAHDAVGEKWLFTAPYEQQGPLILGEGQGMGWFSVHDLDALTIIPHDKDAIFAITRSDAT